MKKFLLLFVLAFLLVGCGESKTSIVPEKVEKFYLDEQYYEKGAITDFTLSDLEKLEKEKGNFGVFVYLPGCTSCAQFRSVLEEYTAENNIEFYTISILDVEDSSIDKVVEYAPSLVLYKDGKIVTYLDSLSDKHIDALSTLEGFNTWLDKYIYTNK